MHAAQLSVALKTGDFVGCLFDPKHADEPSWRENNRKLGAALALLPKFVAYLPHLELEDLVDTAMDLYAADKLHAPFRRCYFEVGGIFKDRGDATGVYLDAAEGMRLFRWSAHEGWYDMGVFVRWPPQDPTCAYEIVKLPLYHPESEPWVMDLTELVFWTVCALMLFLDTKHATQTVIRAAPPHVAVRRAREGRLPLWEYRVVKIDSVARIRASLGGHHASPRLHERRGHLRHLAGRVITVRPSWVGLRERGVIDKHYQIGKGAPEP